MIVMSIADRALTRAETPRDEPVRSAIKSCEAITFDISRRFDESRSGVVEEDR